MQRLSFVILFAALITLSTVTGSTPTAFGVELAPLRYEVAQAGNGAWIPFASSHPPTRARNRRITHIVLAIHSSGFDAIEYMNTGRMAAAKEGLSDKALVIAPQLFQKSVVKTPIPDGLLYWRVSPFRGSSRGAVGLQERHVPVSAYAVVDRMLEELVNRTQFPNLEWVVMFGHSAGGQMVQRYALVGEYEPPRGVQMRFVVSAPSSFAYPTAERLVAGTQNSFQVPNGDVLKESPKYNAWGYGLDGPYGYFAKRNMKALRSRYVKREVYYLCGSRDTDVNDKTMSKTGGAMLQGKQRLDRTLVFGRYMAAVFGDQIGSRHKAFAVKGIGHWGRGTVTSDIGRKALFGSFE